MKKLVLPGSHLIPFEDVGACGKGIADLLGIRFTERAGEEGQLHRPGTLSTQLNIGDEWIRALAPFVPQKETGNTSKL